VDNFYISHSEKNFLGDAGEGKRRVVHYRYTQIRITRISIQELVTKATLKIAIAMPLGSLKTRLKAVLLAILVYP